MAEQRTDLTIVRVVMVIGAPYYIEAEDVAGGRWRRWLDGADQEWKLVEKGNE